MIKLAYLEPRKGNVLFKLLGSLQKSSAKTEDLSTTSRTPETKGPEHMVLQNGSEPADFTVHKKSIISLLCLVLRRQTAFCKLASQFSFKSVKFPPLNNLFSVVNSIKD